MNSVSITNPVYEGNEQPKDILISKIDKKIKDYAKLKNPIEVTMDDVEEKKLAKETSDYNQKAKENARNSGEFKITTRNSPVTSPRISIGKASEVKKDSDIKSSSFSKKAFEFV